MLDINLFREEKDGNPEIVRESQHRRFASVEVVDEVITLDKQWRERQYELENLRKEFNKFNKEISKLKRAGEDATQLIAQSEVTKRLIADKEVEAGEALNSLNSRLETIGNLIHDTVPINKDEV